MERTGTSSLDADLRIRLEGAGEVLEGAAARLEAARQRLSEGLSNLVRDDVDALKAVLASLPAVDDALAKADRLDGAQVLAAEVRRAREALVPVARAALAQLGRDEVTGGLAEHLRALVAALKHLGRPVGPRELALFEGGSGDAAFRWFLAAEAVAAGLMLVGAAQAGAPLAALALVAWLMMRGRQQRWRLLPDRLQVERRGAPLIDVQYEDLTGVAAKLGRVLVRAGELELSLSSARPTALEKLLRSLMQHMGGAKATPGASVVLTGSLEERSVRALVVPQGVWIIERGDERTVIDAVLPGHDGASLEDALHALAHLPAVLLARRLEGLPGTWWPADETRIVETANASLTRVFERNGQTLRVTFGLAAANASRDELDSVISGWKR